MRQLASEITAVILAGILIGAQSARGQAADAASKDRAPFALPNLDSDSDGLPDNVDRDPLIANYTAVRWEVTAISLDYDIKQRIRVASEASSERTAQESTRGSFSWFVGADGRVEGEVRARGGVPADPLELFRLRKMGGLSAPQSPPAPRRESRRAARRMRWKQRHGGRL